MSADTNTCSTTSKSACETCASASSCKESPSDCSSNESKPGQTLDPMALQNAAMAKTFAKIRHTIFVMSGKGGVGKSSVTVNLAASLMQKGYKIGILDVDLHGPSVPNLLGLASNGLDIDEETRQLIPAEYLPTLHVLSIDSLLRDKNSAVLWRGPKKTSAIRQFLADVKWGELDFLLIDSPPGTGDEHMTILKAIPDALCLMVTTPQEVSLADVRKAMNFLQHANGNILGIVENMSGLSCPHCGGDIPLFKRGGGKELAEAYHVPFLGAIAIDPLTVVAADTGKPVTLLEQDSSAKRDFTNLAKIVDENIQKNKYIRMHLPEKNDS